MVGVGQIVSGKYKLVRLLGDGGMGSVYEAEHLGLGTHVAIKVLHADLARRAGIAERFLQEARVSAQIRSPHVVVVNDVDRTADGVAYLVMELLQGETLSGIMKRERRLPVGTACEYAQQILQALEAAHSLGVIHRDLKPDNVFVTFLGGRPVIKLIDFGIAKLKTAQAGQTKNLTVAGMLMGTPEYMAPEQAYSADKVDVRADLYAVGVMLYEMLSGQPPATADDPRVLIGKIERGEVTPLVQVAPGIEPTLAGFVHRAMAPRPELRFASATEMRIALEEIVSGKRAGTAKLAAPSPSVVALGAASTAPLPPAQRGPATFAAGPAASVMPALTGFSEGGGSTVMGAPVDAALGAAGTAGAPPMHGSGGYAPHAPPAHVPPAHGFEPHAPQRPSKRGGSGVIIALAVVALFLGAGAVVAYVLSTQEPSAVVPPILATDTPPTPTPTNTTTASPTVTPVTPLTTSTTPLPVPPGPSPTPTPTAKKDAGTQPQPANDAGGLISVTDAGSGQTTIVTPFGTFQFPGPRPPFYPADQPWPPANVGPSPAQ